MYPYLRTIKTILSAKYRSSLHFGDSGIMNLRAGIFDIDHYGEINNGRQLTLMDLGRYDLGVRGGLMKVVKAKKWGLAVGGSSIRYRRRITLWKKFQLHSELLGHDGRWFYFLQKMCIKDSICSSALIKAGVVSKAGLIPASEVMQEFPDENWSGELPDWVHSWINAESQRPWPSNPTN